MSDGPRTGSVYVLDTSVVIGLKVLPIARQWAFLEFLSGMVRGGAIAFPRQVVKEMAVAQFPDTPGTWVHHAHSLVRYTEPSDDTLARVLAVAPLLVEADASAEREPADPYVAAMALQIAEQLPHCSVVVATEDVVDRLPLKIALGTACGQLGLKHRSTRDFIEWVDEYVDDGGAAS